MAEAMIEGADSLMSGCLVRVQSHQDYVLNWRETLRLRGIWINSRNELDRFWAWECRNILFPRAPRIPKPSDLIPGLPDNLVEPELWTRIRRSFENVGRDPDSEVKLRGIMRNIRALHGTCRKWRFLVDISKSWAAMRILEYELCPIDRFWRTLYSPFFFHKYMRNLPPIDTFSIDRIERLVLWFKCWYDMTKEDREICLQLYDDRHDKLGRLEEWVKQRDFWSNGW